MVNTNCIVALVLVVSANSHDLGLVSKDNSAKQSPDEGSVNDQGIMLLQMRAGVLKRSEPLLEGARSLGMLARTVGFKESVSLLTHAGEDCWASCSQKGGYCDWCGVGNLCCRQGFDENPSECANITSYRPMVKSHQCVASQATYALDAKHMCGACGEENDLHVGIGGRNFDTALQATVAETCGGVCDEDEECGGFSYSASLQKCFYRRVTSCQRAENADRDCYTKAGSRPGYLMTANYIRDPHRRCGACGESNNLMLGVGRKSFDNVTKEEVVKVCGAKCNGDKMCGGFSFIESLGQCHYRKVTSCQASQDSDSDCFTKVAPSQAGDSTKQELAAKTQELQAKLKQQEATLKSKEADAMRLQTALSAQSQMWRRVGEEGAINVNTSINSSDLLPFGNSTGIALSAQESSDLLPFGNSTLTVLSAQNLSDLLPFGNSTGTALSAQNSSDLLPFGNSTGDHAFVDKARLSENQEGVGDSKLGAAVDNTSTQDISGASVDLDEAGYESVVALWNVTEMELFIRRVASDIACNITDKGGLKGFAPFYSMENAQTLESLKAELQSISNEERSAGNALWIVPVERTELGNDTVSLGAPSQESMVEQDSGVHQHSAESSAETADVAASLWRVSNIWWPSDIIQHIKASAQIPSSVGAYADLDEAGYATVIEQGNDTDVVIFTRRLIDDLGCNVTDEGALEGFVPFYGKGAGKNYSSLRAELASVSQKQGAWLAPLEEPLLLEQESTRSQVLTAIGDLAARATATNLHIHGEDDKEGEHQ